MRNIMFYAVELNSNHRLVAESVAATLQDHFWRLAVDFAQVKS